MAALAAGLSGAADEENQPAGKEQAPQKKAAVTQKLLELFEGRTYKEMPYRLMRPIDLADNAEKAYPLVLVLQAAAGRGLENQHYYEPWDVMGDWTTCAIEVEDWMDVPIAETTEEGRRMGAVTPR